jgi:hypothetical protein
MQTRTGQALSDIDDLISRLWATNNSSSEATLTISDVIAGSDEQNAKLSDMLLDWISIFDQFAN